MWLTAAMISAKGSKPTLGPWPEHNSKSRNFENKDFLHRATRYDSSSSVSPIKFLVFVNRVWFIECYIVKYIQLVI